MLVCMGSKLHHCTDSDFIKIEKEYKEIKMIGLSNLRNQIQIPGNESAGTRYANNSTRLIIHYNRFNILKLYYNINVIQDRILRLWDPQFPIIHRGWAIK